MTKLIFGCGYLGERVAKRWQHAGHEVIVVTRSAARAAEFQRDGYQTTVADVTQPDSLRNLPSAETVLYAVGFDRSATDGPLIEDVYAGGMQNVLAALPSSVGRFIYISTTGVYGPAAGEWVDESTPTDPRRDGGRASLAAEQFLAASEFANRGVILRLAGIYGPNRIPFLQQLRNGEPIPAPASGFLNLIHVDDAADIVTTASNPDWNIPATTPAGPRVYCVSDGQPVERGEYYSEVARQISAAPPQFTAPDPNSPRAARAENNRRIRNERLLAELRIDFGYPDYRAGLAAILSS